MTKIQSRPHLNSPALEDVLHAVLPRLADGSLKVGVQGLDANRWRIDEILYVFEAYCKYAEIALQTLGIHVPPVDIWGGGQVSQVPRFLGEDPYVNLSRLSAAGSSLRLKCIYRGRQGFGFLPCSDEIQRIAIAEAANRGVHVFRTFDPMNDWRNLNTSIEVIKSMRKAQLEKGVAADRVVSAEALVFYVRPPTDQLPVADISAMCSYAVKLCEMGFHEIAIADYANQISTPEISAQIFRSVRSALDNARYASVPVNLFAQGCQADIVYSALNSGATNADVSIGQLSGTLSNPNMHEVLDFFLARANCEASAHCDHPALVALNAVRNCVADASFRHLPYRIPEAKLDTGLTSSSRLAFNAVGALHSAITKNWDRLLERPTKTACGEVSRSDRQTRYLQAVLEETKLLWLKGGQFNMVSPMGFFCSFQAEQLVRLRLSGAPLIPSHYTSEFRDVIKGRYGANAGIERGLGDTSLATAFHLLEFFSVLRLQQPEEIADLLQQTGLERKVSATGRCLGKLSINSLETDEQAFSVLGDVDLISVSAQLKTADIDVSLRDRLLFALSKERFPAPVDGIVEGRQVVADILSIANVSDTSPNIDRPLTELDRYALYAILFKVREVDPFCVVKTLISGRGAGIEKTHGDIERDVRPFDKLFDKEITALAQLRAKRLLLRQHGWLVQKSSRQSLKASDGVKLITEKINIARAGIEQKLARFDPNSTCSAKLLTPNIARHTLEYLIDRALGSEIDVLSKTAPTLWPVTDVSNNH